MTRMLSLSEIAKTQGGITWEDTNGDLEWLIEQIAGENTDYDNRAENLMRLIALLERADEDTRNCLFEQAISYIYIRTGHQQKACKQFIDELFNEPRKPTAKTKGGNKK